MKLWLLRPRTDNDRPWEPWYDKAFGFVVRAETEEQARKLVSSTDDDENRWGHFGDEGPEAWSDSKYSTCIELTTEGPEEIIMRDFASA